MPCKTAEVASLSEVGNGPASVSSQPLFFSLLAQWLSYFVVGLSFTNRNAQGILELQQTSAMDFDEPLARILEFVSPEGSSQVALLIVLISFLGISSTLFLQAEVLRAFVLPSATIVPA